MTEPVPSPADTEFPVPKDTTSRVISRILNTNPKVGVGGVDAGGNFKFILFYRPLKITQQDIRNMRLLRRALLADFIGRFLVQSNLNDFLPLLTECDYSDYVRNFPIQRMGLNFDDQRLIFACNIALLYSLINEELAKSILGESANVHLNWDFFQRTPKNTAH